MPWLHRVPQRILVLVGNADSIVRLANGRLLINRIRDARPHFVERGGHLIPVYTRSGYGRDRRRLPRHRRLEGVLPALSRDLTGRVVGSSTSSAEVLRVAADRSTCACVGVVGAALIELQTRVGVDVSQLETSTRRRSQQAQRTDDDGRAIHVVNSTGRRWAHLIGNRHTGLGNASAVVRLRE